ncbi:hypothetical protein M2G95_02080 [Vibrio vulnificus]|uniref:Uncharacterized protein n=1 Tax=Vibrio vulnificus TaxID=672 RepID=A0A8H9N3E5_VIBVL|nr:hypothetical protein [Vibrio vulnificus]EHU5198471.1 hypothetical protein [Vibrio vulnificus]EHY1012034.1 hypothetical protein [Vibrio vulnificus]EHY1121964.1 hypothetical protein [Vibrio vulnificus]ELI0350623.1 hypothetical protein [Vibrio vulnificus]ELV8644636.1 hypothetical protein [Vibrio vulnificus]
MGIEIYAFNTVRKQVPGSSLPKNSEIIENLDIEDLGWDTSTRYVGVKCQQSLAFGYRRFTQFITYLSVLDREFSLSLGILFPSSDGVISHTACVDAYFNQILPIIDDIQSFSTRAYAYYYPENDFDEGDEYLTNISCSETRELVVYFANRKSDFNDFLQLLQFASRNEGFISYG